MSRSQLAANLKTLTKTQSPWRQRQRDWQLRTEIVHGCVCGWSVSGKLEETVPAFAEHA